jgi:hypothetical protein
MDLTVLTDETLLRYYENIRAHVSADIRSGGHHFLGRPARERANLLLVENPRVPRLVKPLSETGHFFGIEVAVVKDRCSAEQLADMITQKINVTGVDVAVRRDHAFGWVPTVISSPSDQIGFQRRADEIAHVLRTRFELA